MGSLILCDGTWQTGPTGWECTGTVTQIVYSAPVEHTPAMAAEAFFHGFATVVPVMAVIFGGRQILKMLR
ncbi:hypothetical protein [Marinobacter zhanjiangensis]|uniref:Uncharacterized protein n=1 Tax=Marinobacter zhanjiangensis TaxID=578215 RepID=A0ABQ3B8C9_9GAMM|nr:hypothetical protein [Marinobacter zhanjiangensis]GGY83592.1 hypothetical protein GCM10007071_33620 [Marinobacter zhanjiangensis]